MGRGDHHRGRIGGDRIHGGGATRPQRSSLAAIIAVESAIVVVAAAVLAISAHRAVLRRAEGLLLGLGAGALFGVSNVAIKFLTHAEGPIHGLLSPWTLTALIAGAISFYASARSLQLGPAVEVIALTSVAANLAAIIGGVLVFDEPIGSGPVEIGARLIAFCLVIAGAALMPGHRTTRRVTVDPPPKVTISQDRS